MRWPDQDGLLPGRGAPDTLTDAAHRVGPSGVRRVDRGGAHVERVLASVLVVLRRGIEGLAPTSRGPAAAQASTKTSAVTGSTGPVRAWRGRRRSRRQQRCPRCRSRRTPRAHGREDPVLFVQPLRLDAEDVGVRGNMVGREIQQVEDRRPGVDRDLVRLAVDQDPDPRFHLLRVPRHALWMRHPYIGGCTSGAGVTPTT